ncbi:hypothetical protein ABG067_001259 [Albugo candida]|uniref:Uncharacterized protein n=1 Tax=Albugo candida TaxID=65357 RepID=A0A024FUK3_9STRA|nr:unnamed protein product [Albugo candida]|eukprot:CCI10582.1 unnamed protein product [Albugo candida]
MAVCFVPYLVCINNFHHKYRFRVVEFRSRTFLFQAIHQTCSNVLLWPQRNSISFFLVHCQFSAISATFSIWIAPAYSNKYFDIFRSPDLSALVFAYQNAS